MRRILTTVIIFLCLPVNLQPLSGQDFDLDSYDLSFEQLAKLRFSTTSSITATDKRHEPATVTTIDEFQLRLSGTPNLARALEIYVPNFQIQRSVFNSYNLGMRGIENDADEKYLMLVNGHPIHSRYIEGVQTEKMLSLTGDIHNIDVVRGPASILYGPGAIVGVIDLKTHTGLTFQGLDLKLHQRFIDETSAMEWRWGKKIDNETGVFVYYGVENHIGADHDDSPVYYGNSFVTNTGVNIIAGEESPLDEPNDHHFSELKHKFFFDYTAEDFNFWIRYNKEGEQQHGRWQFHRQTPPGSADAATDLQKILEYRVNDYQNFMSSISQIFHMTEKLNLTLSGGYDYRRRHFQLALPSNEKRIFENLEDQFWASAIFSLKLNENHKFAFGLEGSLEHYRQYVDQAGLPPRTEWHTYTNAYLAEYQWIINPQWTMFASGRYDKHSFTDHIFSPRFVVIFTPSDRDTFKLMASRSVRRVTDLVLFNEHQKGESPKTETNDTVEFRYERQQTKALTLASSTGFQVFVPVDSIAKLGAGGQSQQLFGRYKIFFMELEALYRNENWHVSVSHSFTKLIESDETTLIDPARVSVEAKGKGGDLANWSVHQSKLAIIHKLNPKFSWNASAVIYWGFPGLEDLAEYNSFERPGGPSNSAFPYIDEHYDDAFKEQIFVDAGCQYNLNENSSFRLDLYNIMGWFDDHYNKRNYRSLSDSFRSEAASVGISFHHKF